MKHTVRQSAAPNIHEGRALTLTILKARMRLSRRGHPISAVPRKTLRQ